jgi:hypothetical protein
MSSPWRSTSQGRSGHPPRRRWRASAGALGEHVQDTPDALSRTAPAEDHAASRRAADEPPAQPQSAVAEPALNVGSSIPTETAILREEAAAASAVLLGMQHAVPAAARDTEGSGVHERHVAGTADDILARVTTPPPQLLSDKKKPSLEQWFRLAWEAIESGEDAQALPPEKDNMLCYNRHDHEARHASFKRRGPQYERDTEGLFSNTRFGCTPASSRCANAERSSRSLGCSWRTRMAGYPRGGLGACNAARPSDRGRTSNSSGASRNTCSKASGYSCTGRRPGRTSCWCSATPRWYGVWCRTRSSECSSLRHAHDRSVWRPLWRRMSGGTGAASAPDRPKAQVGDDPAATRERHRGRMDHAAACTSRLRRGGRDAKLVENPLHFTSTTSLFRWATLLPTRPRSTLRR